MYFVVDETTKKFQKNEKSSWQAGMDMIRYLSRCWGEVVKNKKVLEKRKKFLTNENGYDKIIKLLKNSGWLKELNKKFLKKL